MNIIITGASSGIGRALAFQLSSPGNKLILNGRSEERLAEVLEDVVESQAVAVVGDLGNLDVQDSLFKAADGEIDMLILSAGVYLQNPILDRVREDTALYRKTADVFDTNCADPIKFIWRLFPYLVKTRGSIVHMNSVAGKNLAPNEALYSASKHAMTGFLRSLRMEAREHGVRILDVFLGGVDTPMTEHKPDHEKLMDVAEVAESIAAVIELNQQSTLQIEELQLGRLIF